MLFTKNTKHTLNYHLVTAEPPFTVETINCVQQTGSTCKKGAYDHPAVSCYPHAWRLPSFSLYRSLCQKLELWKEWKSMDSIAGISYYLNKC